ncbi:uncharacterized protein BKA78DRAFT_228515, partial [Phyllosticta capitalensis]|uniref:uncharacterized protein n=1 Tax=Phyllosticta capitalensis TaxID=121624 RepID=UPI0031301897
IKLQDPIGRKFSFPWHRCKSWKDMEELIKSAFVRTDGLGRRVHDGHYHLVGPDDEIILPLIWEDVVQP